MTHLETLLAKYVFRGYINIPNHQMSHSCSVEKERAAVQLGLFDNPTRKVRRNEIPKRMSIKHTSIVQKGPPTRTARLGNRNRVYPTVSEPASPSPF